MAASRGGCHTDCVEQPLSRGLRALGSLVGAHPWPFLLLPLALSGALSTGFLLLRSLEANDLEEQFTPVGGPAKGERRFVRAHFATDDAARFSPERLVTEGTYASLIAVAVEEGAGAAASLFALDAFAEVVALDAAVRNLRASGRAFEHLCARGSSQEDEAAAAEAGGGGGGACWSPNPLVSAVKGEAARFEPLRPNLTYPLFQEGRVFLGYYVGGATVGPGGGAGGPAARPLREARAMRLVYFLQEDDAARRNASEKWLGMFLQHISGVLDSLHLVSVRVSYFTSISRQNEFEKLSKDVIPLVSITYFLTIFFTIVSCSRLDCVRTKVWVASFGVLTAGLSVISSFGLLMLCDVPFVITAANSPFLILGVGVDDMFIIVSCWQHTKVKDSVKDRMADTYAEAAVSITITTLTDVLAFYIGIGSSFPSIQSFCIYTGTSFVFCYIYNLTFLGAVLALNGRREKSNRHWLTFKKVEHEAQESQGYLYNVCCVGGSFDESTGAETEHPMNEFFREHYGPFLVHTWAKIFVVILYLLYIGSSIYGCTQVKEGINVRHLALDHSYVVQYYDWEDEYFSNYGPRVMVLVTERTAYWDSSVRADLEKCMRALETSSYVDENLSLSWLRVYETVAQQMSININEQTSFIRNLPALFAVNPEFKQDLDSSTTEISASRFFIQTVNVTNAVHEKHLLSELRRLAKDCKIPLMVYHPGFIYYDQFVVIIHNTIQNILIATGTMLFISLLLIPNPVCSLWVTFAIASVIIGVTGFMAFWNVALDSISMINLVICVGFSVDYSAHISYAFVASDKPNVNGKAVDALYHLGYPIVQASLSTLVGVFVLSVSSTYIFRTFFKIMSLVILLGTLHGLVFIPVFLTIFGFCGGLSNKRIDVSHSEIQS